VNMLRIGDGVGCTIFGCLIAGDGKETPSDECIVYRFTIFKIFVVFFLVFCRYKGTKGRHKYQAGIAERLFVSASKRDCYNLAQHRAARLTTFGSRRRLEHPSTQVLPD
jgi:hypothetical protein